MKLIIILLPPTDLLSTIFMALTFLLTLQKPLVEKQERKYSEERNLPCSILPGSMTGLHIISTSLQGVALEQRRKKRKIKRKRRKEEKERKRKKACIHRKIECSLKAGEIVLTLYVTDPSLDPSSFLSTEYGLLSVVGSDLWAYPKYQQVWPQNHTPPTTKRLMERKKKWKKLAWEQDGFEGQCF